MSKQKNELGKGLRALLTGIDKTESRSEHKIAQPITSSDISEIKLSDIESNIEQPRKNFDEKELEDLAQSIKTYGLIQPITVRRLSKNKYQIISGERRWRASKIAGLTKVPVYVRKANDQELLEMALVENIQRSDLNPIEIAISYHRLIDECNITHQELSTKVGMERSTISNYVRLLKLPPSIQSAVKNNIVSMGHARALAGVENATDQLNVFKEIISKELSVRATEKLIKNEKTTARTGNNSGRKEGLTPEVLKIQDGLSNLLETKVKISRNTKGKGQISIPFSSDKSFNNLLEQLGYL